MDVTSWFYKLPNLKNSLVKTSISALKHGTDVNARFGRQCSSKYWLLSVSYNNYKSELKMFYTRTNPDWYWWILTSDSPGRVSSCRRDSWGWRRCWVKPERDEAAAATMWTLVFCRCTCRKARGCVTTGRKRFDCVHLVWKTTMSHRLLLASTQAWSLSSSSGSYSSSSLVGMVRCLCLRPVELPAEETERRHRDRRDDLMIHGGDMFVWQERHIHAYLVCPPRLSQNQSTPHRTSGG